MSNTHLEAGEVKGIVKQHWSDRAATFDDVAHHAIHSDGQRAAWVDLLRRVTEGRTVRALDVGCGTGFLTLLLADLGTRVDGVDIAPPMLEHARAKAEAQGLSIRFFEGDAESLPVPDADYDLLVERHVIWTVPNPEAALREWRRVLRPGGRVALIEGAWGRRETVQPDYEPIRDALPLYGGSPPSVLSAMLEAAGFGEITTEPLLDPALWGDEVRHERYLITGIRGRDAAT
jgi:ubiquinone/menaquinone biosynthesis C-methylase UbiE